VVERLLWTEGFARRSLETKDVDGIARMALIASVGNMEGLNAVEKKRIFDAANERIRDLAKPIDPSSAYEASSYVRKVINAGVDVALSAARPDAIRSVVKAGADLGIDFVVDTTKYLDLSKSKMIQENAFALVGGSPGALLAIPGQVYDAVSKDPDFGGMVAPYTRQHIGAGVGDSVDAIFDLNPSLVDSALIRDGYTLIKDTNGRVKSVQLHLDKISGHLDRGFSALARAQAEGTRALQRSVALIPRQTANEVIAALDKRDDLSRRLSAVREANDTGVRATLGFFQLGMNSLGGQAAQFGNGVAAAGNATLQVVGAVERYNNQIAAIDNLMKAGEMTSQAASQASMMANVAMGFTVVGAGMAAVSIISSMQQQGPSADQIIMEQLGMIMRQLEEIRKTMREGFDSVNRNINENIRLTQLGFQRVLADMEKIDSSIADAALSLARIRDLIERRSVVNFAAFQELLARIREDNVGACVKVATDPTKSPSAEDLSDCAYRTRTYGANSRLIGEKAMRNEWTTLERARFIALDLYEWKTLAENLNQMLGISLETNLPDTSAWSLASEAIVRMATTRTRPGAASPAFGDDIGALIEAGERIESVAGVIRRTNVLERLVDQYELVLETFGDRLDLVAVQAWKDFQVRSRALDFTRFATGKDDQQTAEFRKKNHDDSKACGNGRICGDSGSWNLWQPIGVRGGMKVQSPALLAAARAGLGEVKYDYGFDYSKIVIAEDYRHCAGDLKLELMARWVAPNGAEGKGITLMSDAFRNRTRDTGTRGYPADDEPVMGPRWRNSKWPDIPEACHFWMYKDLTYKTAMDNRPFFENSMSRRAWAPADVQTVESEVAASLLRHTEEAVRPELVRFLAEAIQRDLLSPGTDSLRAIGEQLTLHREMIEKTIRLAYAAELPRYPGIMRALNGEADRLWDSARLIARMGELPEAEKSVAAILKRGAASEASAWREALVAVEASDAQSMRERGQRRQIAVQLSQAQTRSRRLGDKNPQAKPVRDEIGRLENALALADMRRTYGIAEALRGENPDPKAVRTFMDPRNRLMTEFKAPLEPLRGELAALRNEAVERESKNSLSAIAQTLANLRMASRLSSR
jgi:hypothetical protein